MRSLLTAVLIVTLLTIGCSTGNAPDFAHVQGAKEVEQTNYQLEREREELLQRIAGLEKELALLKREREERNLVDLQARALLSAMAANNIEEIKQLVAQNVTVENGKLVFTAVSDTSVKMEYAYPKKAEKLRQRWYMLQEDGRFLTGMEVYDGNTLIAVPEMTFIKENGSWKLTSIYNDI